MGGAEYSQAIRPFRLLQNTEPLSESPAARSKQQGKMFMQGPHQTRVWLRLRRRFVLLYLSAALLCALTGGWLGSLPPPAGREIIALMALPAALLAGTVAVVAWLRHAST